MGHNVSPVHNWDTFADYVYTLYLHNLITRQYIPYYSQDATL